MRLRSSLWARNLFVAAVMVATPFVVDRYFMAGFFEPKEGDTLIQWAALFFTCAALSAANAALAGSWLVYALVGLGKGPGASAPGRQALTLWALSIAFGAASPIYVAAVLVSNYRG
jgi:hypothetical protein